MCSLAKKKRGSAQGPEPLAGEGPRAIVEAFKAIIDRPTLLCTHQGHHPEIKILGADRARGTWYLVDHVIDLAGDWMLHGTAFYQDEYVKRDGHWRSSNEH